MERLFRLARSSPRAYGLALALAVGATIATPAGVGFAATPTDIVKVCTAAGGTRDQINTCIRKATIDASRRGYDGTVASAAAFRASVGANVPDTSWNTPYGQWDKVLQTLKTAGITHIRSGFSANPANDNGWNQYLYKLINQAQAKGVYFMMGFQGPLNAYAGYTNDFISRIKTKINPAMVDAIEYPNEYDWNGTDPNWATDLSPWAKTFVKAWRADPVLKSKPVVGPALVLSSSVPTLASQGLGDYVDIGNIHPYCGATTPTRTHDLNEFSRMKPLTGSKPIWASEAGTHTAMNAPPGSGMLPAPESVQAVYTLREYLQHYHDGIGRTYIYHLIDLWPDPDRTHPERNFGLIHADFTPKPAFTALTNLNSLVGSGVPTVLRPLEHTVSGDVKGDLQHMVLERGDGSYDVVLWRQAEIYDRDTKTILSVPAETITVGLPKAKSVTAGDPLKEATGHALTLNGSVRVDVGADPIVLHVTLRGQDTKPVTVMPATPLSPTGSPSSDAAPAKASFKRSKRTIRVGRSGRFSFAFAAGPGLRGRITLRTVRKVRPGNTGPKRRTTFGRKSFSVPPSGKPKINLKLSSQNRRILKRYKRLRVDVAVKLRNSADLTSTARVTITLKV